MQDTISAWKRTLRVQRRKKSEARIEELSATPLSLAEVTPVVECEKMWSDVEEVIEQLENGEEVSDVAINRCSIALAGLLMFKS